MRWGRTTSYLSTTAAEQIGWYTFIQQCVEQHWAACKRLLLLSCEGPPEFARPFAAAVFAYSKVCTREARESAHMCNRVVMFGCLKVAALLVS